MIVNGILCDMNEHFKNDKDVYANEQLIGHEYLFGGIP